MNNFKEWWLNLALREKQMVALGGCTLFIIIFYFFIWSPFTNHLDNLRHDIQTSQQLLMWMQASNKKILTIENQQKKQKSRLKIRGSLLGIIQKRANQSPLAKNISFIQQADNNAVQLQFKNVNFDQLMSWLIQLWQTQGIVISQMSVTPVSAQGIVEAEVVLAR